MPEGADTPARLQSAEQVGLWRRVVSVHFSFVRGDGFCELHNQLTSFPLIHNGSDFQVRKRCVALPQIPGIVSAQVVNTTRVERHASIAVKVAIAWSKLTSRSPVYTSGGWTRQATGAIVHKR